MGKAFYKKLEIEYSNTVYEPTEDSFLLADSVNVEKGKTLLDLGCGAGLVSVLASQQGAIVTAADFNPDALEIAIKNSKNYGFDIKTIETDMFSNITEKYDYIYFNPPYLPHEDIDDELAKKTPELARAWDGGKEGRKYIDIFLNEYREHLNGGGKAYLLNSSLNDITKTTDSLDKQNVKYAMVGKKELFFEKLYIYEILK